MDFAPYQAAPPETSRSPPSSPRASLEARRPSPLPNPWSAPPHYPPPPGVSGAPDDFNDDVPGTRWPAWLPRGLLGGGREVSVGHLPGAFPGGEPDRLSLSEFSTSLGLRLDHEAALAYILFPPVGSFLLFIFERKSDYVRFHAVQAGLLFALLGFVHWVVSWSGLLAYVVVLGEMAAGLYLAWRAWRDADSLERYEVPFVGPIASRALGDDF